MYQRHVTAPSQQPTTVATQSSATGSLLALPKDSASPAEPNIGMDRGLIPAPAPAPAKAPSGFNPVTGHEVRADANAQVVSVNDAIKTKSHPSRLSPLIQPAKFDPAAYRNNPHAYLDVAEPGRMFTSAQPAADTPRIRQMTPLLQDVQSGQGVSLKVKAAPNWPVTFTSVDLGQFGNGLNTVTVEANDVGVAETTFYASKGTTNGARILAASPMASGQASFFVNIK